MDGFTKQFKDEMQPIVSTKAFSIKLSSRFRLISLKASVISYRKKFSFSKKRHFNLNYFLMSVVKFPANNV